MSGSIQNNPANATPTYTATGGAPKGYEQITDVSAAVGLTVPPGAKIAVIQATAQAVRYRDDGVDPTDAIGMPLAVDQQFAYTADLATIKFIEQASGAVLDITYYG